MILLKSIYTYLVWISIIIEVVLGMTTIGWIRFVPTIRCFGSYVSIQITRAIPSGEYTAVIIVSVEIAILITWKNYWRMGSSGFPESVSLANWIIWIVRCRVKSFSSLVAARKYTRNFSTGFNIVEPLVVFDEWIKHFVCWSLATFRFLHHHIFYPNI